MQLAHERAHRRAAGSASGCCDERACHRSASSALVPVRRGELEQQSACRGRAGPAPRARPRSSAAPPSRARPSTAGNAPLAAPARSSASSASSGSSSNAPPSSRYTSRVAARILPEHQRVARGAPAELDQPVAQQRRARRQVARHQRPRLRRVVDELREQAAIEPAAVRIAREVAIACTRFGSISGSSANISVDHWRGVSSNMRIRSTSGERTRASIGRARSAPRRARASRATASSTCCAPASSAAAVVPARGARTAGPCPRGRPRRRRAAPRCPSRQPRRIWYSRRSHARRSSSRTWFATSVYGSAAISAPRA